MTEVVRRLALAHPGVRFTLSGADRLPLDFPPRPGAPALRQERIAQVIGAEFLENAMPIAAEREGARLAGYAGLPTFNRANSLQQFLFVNGRPLRDPLLAGALRAAYADVLARDRFPVVALFLEMRPGGVRRERASGQARSALPRSRHGARADHRRDPRRAWRSRAFAPRRSVGAATLAAFRPRAHVASAPIERRNGAAAWQGWAAPAAQGFAEEEQAGFAVLDRPSADARAGVAEPDAAQPRPPARRGARAAPRELHRRADRRRARHRRPARRARADRLRAAEGGARAARRVAAPDHAHPGDRRAAARRCRAASSRAPRSLPRSGSASKRSGRARSR